MNGSVGRTGQESRADHSTCQAAGSEGARGTNHPASAVRTAPARHRITGAEGPTLPPPIRPRRPPRPGVLAAGRAGTAAGGPGPEASCHCQPWLKLRGYPTGSGLAPHRPPPARREDGAGRDATRWRNFLVARGPASRKAGPLPGSPETRMCGLQSSVYTIFTSTPTYNSVEDAQWILLKEFKDPVVLFPAYLFKRHFSSQKA